MQDEMKQQFQGLNWMGLADAVEALTREKQELEDLLKEIEDRLNYITIDIIPNRLAEENMRNVTLSDGSQFVILHKATCWTRSGKREALFKWMRENGYEELITEVVNSMTLKSFIKEQLSKGAEVPPDDIIDYRPFAQASLRGRGLTRTVR